jgi:O-acetyl-ADP-ribose deacetylase (regulator of RNase III)
MPLTIVSQDITTMTVDAIVNAANTALQMGGGVCGAIFRAAGASEMQAACDKLAPIRTGEAVVTPGFGLPTQFVIHTAGPVYHDGRHGEEQLLRNSYTNSLKRAVENGCKSVAFPLISSGIYGYPKEEALSVAASAIKEFIAGPGQDIDVYLAVLGGAAPL